MEKSIIFNCCRNWGIDAFDQSGETVNSSIQTNLMNFVQFSFTLAVELQLLSDTKLQKDGSFDSQFNKYLELLFNQPTKLEDALRFVDYRGNRVDTWIDEFLRTLEDMECVYPDSTWKMKMLRKLPDSFDSLFKTYFGQKCTECENVPSQPIICLICGQLLCLDNCCAQYMEINESSTRISEVEIHANMCCSGSACFLSITSTM